LLLYRIFSFVQVERACEPCLEIRHLAVVELTRTPHLATHFPLRFKIQIKVRKQDGSLLA